MNIGLCFSLAIHSSKKAHFVFAGVFYYLLVNIHPMYRSAILNIQLIGIDKMLLPFTHELNKLVKVCLSVLFIAKSNIFNIQLSLVDNKCVNLLRWQERAGLHLEQCRKKKSGIETHCHLLLTCTVT